MTITEEFTKGFWSMNPLFRLLLGLCPTLAVTTEAINGFAMGMATTFVLVCSNVVISLLKGLIPAKVRIPCFIVVIASFVTVVDLVMHGFFFQLHKALGIFIPLIVVNCIILGRAEAFASKNTTVRSIVDGLGMGLGFAVSLTVVGAVREAFGNGTLFGASVFGEGYLPFLALVLPPGAFITLGIILGLMNKIEAVRSGSSAGRP